MLSILGGGATGAVVVLDDDDDDAVDVEVMVVFGPPTSPEVKHLNVSSLEMGTFFSSKMTLIRSSEPATPHIVNITTSVNVQNEQRQNLLCSRAP